MSTLLRPHRWEDGGDVPRVEDEDGEVEAQAARVWAKQGSAWIPAVMHADGGIQVHITNPAGGGGGGGGIVQQGAKDATAEAWDVALSGTVALDAPSLAALETVQVGNFPANQPVTGPLTDAQLRASAVAVDVTDAIALDATVGAVRDRLPAGLSADRVKVALVTPAGADATIPQGHTVRVGAIVTAPAANAVLVDSGALVAGEYNVEVHWGSTGVAAVGKGMALEHRNSANNANLWTYTVPTPYTGGPFQTARMTFAANERLRVVNAPTVGEASSRYSALIVMRLVT